MLDLSASVGDKPLVERSTKRKKSTKRTPKVSISSELEIEQVALSLLRPHPRNYREHPPDQIAHIKASIRATGFYKNVVAARDGTILAGHGVVIASNELGLKTAPTVRLNIDRDSPLALKILAGDNEMSKLGSVDDRALTEILKSIADSKEGLEGTGYDEKMLAALVMVTRPAGEIENIAAAAEWIGLPEFAQGEGAAARIVVNFESKADRDRFVKETGIHVLRGSSAWWPPRKPQDLSSIAVEG